MHSTSFRVQNFRRLKHVRVNLDADRTIFVGANNSGKTLATHLFRLFIGRPGLGAFQIYDLSAECWDDLDAFDPATGSPATLPQSTFDLWFHVEPDDVHRALPLLPGLD